LLPPLPRAAAAASGHNCSLLLLLLLLPPACCARLAFAFMSARFSRRRFSTCHAGQRKQQDEETTWFAVRKHKGMR
jgi:hypothetical protein